MEIEFSHGNSTGSGLCTHSGEHSAEASGDVHGRLGSGLLVYYAESLCRNGGESDIGNTIGCTGKIGYLGESLAVVAGLENRSVTGCSTAKASSTSGRTYESHSVNCPGLRELISDIGIIIVVLVSESVGGDEVAIRKLRIVERASVGNDLGSGA